MAILTVSELRMHVDHPTGTDQDTALQLLLDASEEAIVKAAGASGSVTEYLDGGWSRIIVSRPISTLTSVTVDFDGTPLTLAADDHRFTSGGWVLTRLSTGTNPASVWSGKVQVIYTPTDDAETRKITQIALVRLCLAHHPGLIAQTIGDWSEQFASNSVMNFAVERDLILSTLAPTPGMVVV